jgi:hypothetical protein
VAYCFISSLSTWLLKTQDWRDWEPATPQENTLQVYKEFSISHGLMLSNCYIINHWWIAIIQAVGSSIFDWLDQLNATGLLVSTILHKVAYIWFVAPMKKPPDKREELAKQQSKQPTLDILQILAYIVYAFEDLLFYTFKKDIDLCYWTYVIGSLLSDYLFELVQLFLAIELSDENHDTKEWTMQTNNKIPIYEVNEHDPYRFKRGKLITSNLMLSLSTKSNKNELDSTVRLDTDSYNIAIDTCTSETIVRHKELFVGKIQPCKNLLVQGVGGHLKASGYGTIKIRITCDEGNTHDLLIHNVIYLPESPVNLLSPQKWSLGNNDEKGTGEITVGDSTLLFWNNKQATKLIPHHPDLGIPIMTINDGYTKSNEFLKAATTSMFCQPCNEDVEVAFRSSQVIEDPRTKLQHIIPIDDDEELISKVPNQQYNNVRVDELDKMKKVIEGNLEDLLPSNRLDNLNEATTVSQSTDDVSTEDDDNTFEWIDEDDTFETVQIPVNEIDKIVSSISEQTSDLQRELLRYHFKLKHLPFSALKQLAEKGTIPKRLAKCPTPMCYPCQMGKQHKKPWRGKGKKRKHIRKARDNFPGANTSTDQMISPFGGMIPQVKGRLMKAKYYAATIFVDHHTDYTYVHLMRNTTAETTLEAKNAYEHLLQTFGHKVLAYHADNGRFAEKVFVQDVKDKAQNITYCGVGSHHQNGIAERLIRTLGEDARTMLAHGQHLWPEVVSKSLWPYAYKAACRTRNKFKLDSEMLSPEEKMSGITYNNDIKNEHPLFCPVFVLDKRLQGGVGGIPKWNPRANASVYLGHSPDHASNVALVLNLSTGLVSPQYHVVFDDDFSTVDFIRSKQEPSNWENLCRYHTEDYRMEALPGVQTLNELNLDMPQPPPPTNATSEHPILDNSTTSELQLPSSSDTTDHASATSTNTLQQSSDVSQSSSIANQSGDDQYPTNRQEGENMGTNETFEIPTPSDNVDSSEGVASATDTPQISSDSPGTRRSSRVRKPVERLTSSKLGELSSKSLLAALVFVTSYLIKATKAPEHCYVAFKANLTQKIVSYNSKMMYYQEAVQLNVDGSSNYMHPFAFITKNNNNDTFYFHQAMQQDDRDDFVQAMIKELEDHKVNKHWKLVKRNTIGDAPTIKAIWSFKRKRRPDGSLLKHKARLCAHGGMQIHGENFWDTYAPVVQWISIRMMLTLSVIHDLYTTSIDFTLAFPQAKTDVTIYMEVPIGCSVPEGDYVCLLLKNLYGLKQAAKTWFEYLRDSLTLSEEEGGHGFKQSPVDPCVFYKKGITLISWVDDCLIFAKDKALADDLIINLRKTFTLSEEEDVSAYLGVKMKIDKEANTVSMSQPFLIDRIIELLGDAVKDANVKNTPAVNKEILHKDEDGPERKQPWNYRSAIGMLNYLAASTRPDCLFAVHQCARFSANPKLSHERAVKRIVRYLKGTRDEGLIIKPDATAGVQCFVDADFAGGYSQSTCDDPVSVFSRTGYCIFYLGCPVIWVSKMQSEISLSTTEAEYIALSQSMRDLIPFIDHIQEMDTIYDQLTTTPIVSCTLFEDNNGALELARTPRYRPRTKHIAIKYHHFREHVKSGRIKILAIDTREQIADQFTKGLSADIFKYLRFKLMGW